MAKLGRSKLKHEDLWGPKLQQPSLGFLKEMPTLVFRSAVLS